MNQNRIEEHCKILHKSRCNSNLEQLKSSFDIFVDELNRIENPDEKYRLIEQILLPLTNFPHRQKKLSEGNFISHQLFVIFRDFVIIQQLQGKDLRRSKLLLNVCRLFSNLCYNINEINANEIRNLIFNPSFIAQLGNCLNEISRSGECLSNDLYLRSIGFLLSTFQYFRKNQISDDEYILINPILFGVIECLCSPYSIEILRNLETNFLQKLNDCQMLLLDRMPSYLQWYSSNHRHPENFIQILRYFLPEYTHWLTHCPADTFNQCNSKLATMIRHLSCFLIRPIESEILNHFCEEFSSDYCRLVSFWSSVLTHLTNEMHVRFTTRIVIQNLYNLTLHFDVLNWMKTLPNLIPMLLRMTDVQDDEIQLNTYRCLGKLMNEKDIKTMANPDKITSVYIEFIRNTIDDPKNQERFFSLLKSLKNFVQHDQVKSELIKQQALPIFIKCVLESQYDPIQAQMICLEILLALSFNSSAYSILKYHQTLIDHIRLLTHTDQSGLQRAAEGLLWKLETEEEAMAKSSISNIFKYDIMISYSHKNQQISLQIHQQLIQDGFRVWIDKDCLRGSTMVGMANAIENSEYVLICMSNNYKQSVYCQSEAHYAFERRCLLIPIIIEQNYKPDGWLGIIVSGKIYVDFANVEFNQAYQRLKGEIRQQKYSIEPLLNDIQPILDLPYCITQWTNDHVKSFLFQKKLNKTILPLCSDMTGEELIQLYQICLINRESMYQALKDELNHRHQTLLPIADYIFFLQHIKSYIPSNSSFTRCQLF